MSMRDKLLKNKTNNLHLRNQIYRPSLVVTVKLIGVFVFATLMVHPSDA